MESGLRRSSSSWQQHWSRCWPRRLPARSWHQRTPSGDSNRLNRKPSLSGKFQRRDPETRARLDAGTAQIPNRTTDWIASGSDNAFSGTFDLNGHLGPDLRHLKRRAARLSRAAHPHAAGSPGTAQRPRQLFSDGQTMGGQLRQQSRDDCRPLRRVQLSSFPALSLGRRVRIPLRWPVLLPHDPSIARAVRGLSRVRRRRSTILQLAPPAS